MLKGLLKLLDSLGVSKKYKDVSKKNIRYRRNLYNSVDPNAAYPTTIKDAIAYKALADKALEQNHVDRYREVDDRTADAAWAKRLGLPYNKSYLPDNKDGSVKLPKHLEDQIPVDTVFIKNRIANNNKLKDYYIKQYGRIPYNKSEAINLALEEDNRVLDALRKTYATGKPVVINEQAYIDRNWIKNGETHLTPSPLSVLQNYTIKYNKDTNTFDYYDKYDFNEFENFVPGDPFIIRGTIPVKSQKTRDKKQFGGSVRRSLATGGKIYIKPSHRGRLTELKERTGKSEAELYNDGNPAHKKMVVFARNARKWNK